MGVDSNGTVVLLGDGPRGDLVSANGTVECRPGRFRPQTHSELRPVVGQASDQAIRTSRAGVAAGRRRTHQLQGIRGPTQIRSPAEPSHSRVTTTAAAEPTLPASPRPAGTGLTGYLVLDRGVGGDARSSAVGEVGIGPGADDTGGPTSRAAPAGQRDLEDPVGRPEGGQQRWPPTNTVYMSLSAPGRDGGCSRE